MLEHKIIDNSEGIDVLKTNLSKECDNCHYWYFKDIGFKYEPYLCNGCHDLMQKAMSFNNITIVYVGKSTYRIHFWHTLIPLIFAPLIFLLPLIFAPQIFAHP